MAGRALVCGVMALLGCTQLEPVLLVTVDKRSIDGRNERAVLHVEAIDATGKGGKGVARLTASAGGFVEGDGVPLVEGITTATFRCDPADDETCSGDVRLGVDWGGSSAGVVVRVGPITRAAPVYWKVVGTGTSVDLVDVAMSPDGTAWAVGGDGVVLRLTGTSWQSMPSGVTTALTGVWAGPTGSVVVVGSGGVLLTWDGQALVQLSSGTDDDFSGVSGFGGASVFVTSLRGNVYSFDGAALTWRFQASAALRSVFARSPTEAWAVGDGVIVRLEGGAWREELAPVLGQWSAVRVDPQGVWIGGERADVAQGRGLVMQGPVPEWRSAQLGEGIKGLYWSDASEERFAITSQEVYRKIADEGWTPLRAPAGGQAIAGRSSSDFVVVGSQGLALRRVP